MRLFRFGAPGLERPGVVLPDGTHVDASAVATDWDERFFAGDGLERLAVWAGSAGANAPRVEPTVVRLGPAVARPSKIVCIGLNYRDHAAETGAAIPAEPIVFMKAPSAFAGTTDDLILPRASQKSDWEIELAVVIGRRARYVAPKDAMEHLAGFALMNDYSERALQNERGGQWVKGKSADGFAAFGPYLVTRDEVPDPGALRLWLRVNGELMQDGSTANMIVGVAGLVSYVSEFMTLVPGDVISTGTPAGVGLGKRPPRFLRAGDNVEFGVEGLGQGRQRVFAWS